MITILIHTISYGPPPKIPFKTVRKVLKNIIDFKRQLLKRFFGTVFNKIELTCLIVKLKLDQL